MKKKWVLEWIEQGSSCSLPLTAEKRKSVSLRVWSHIKHGSERGRAEVEYTRMGGGGKRKPRAGRVSFRWGSSAKEQGFSQWPGVGNRLRPSERKERRQTTAGAWQTALHWFSRNPRTTVRQALKGCCAWVVVLWASPDSVITVWGNWDSGWLSTQLVSVKGKVWARTWVILKVSFLI